MLTRAPSCSRVAQPQQRLVPRVTRNAMPLRQRYVLRRAAQDENSGKGISLQESWDKFLQRYEQQMLSSAIGAGAVTTWCMVHGQSPGEAAAITVMSTITAMVLNEVLFSDDVKDS